MAEHGENQGPAQRLVHRVLSAPPPGHSPGAANHITVICPSQGVDGAAKYPDLPPWWITLT
jgi:hypothetical protein